MKKISEQELIQSRGVLFIDLPIKIILNYLIHLIHLTNLIYLISNISYLIHLISFISLLFLHVYFEKNRLKKSIF